MKSSRQMIVVHPTPVGSGKELMDVVYVAPAFLTDARGNRLEREIRQVEPKAILAMGKGPVEFLTGYEGHFEDTVGKLLFTRSRNVPVIPCWHPGFAARSHRRQAEMFEAVENWRSLLWLQ
jgi:uracil-DNA glycosylase